MKKHTAAGAQVIDLSRSREREQTAAWEQIQWAARERRRRLQWQTTEEKQEEEVGDDDESRRRTSTVSEHEQLQQHPYDWRRPYHSDDRHLAAGDTVTAVPLQNCHLALYTGQVRIGQPPQTFQVDYDTAVSDLWVVSSECVSPACKAVHHKFVAADSTTYVDAAKPAEQYQLFFNATMDGTHYLLGKNGRDSVLIGPSGKALPPSQKALQIPHQVFAQVTDLPVPQSDQCTAVEGVLGLGHALHTPQGFQTVLGHLNQQERHAMFGFYAAAEEEEGEPPSSMVMGGVDQTHYQDCLVWHDTIKKHVHDALQVPHKTYWDMHLDGARVGDTPLPSDSPEMVAMLDSGSYYMIGPAEAIQTIATINQLACMQMDPTTPGGGVPVMVQCDDPAGFDIIAVDCDAKSPIQPLTFYAGSESYVLEHDDLVYERFTTPAIPGSPQVALCLLRLLAAPPGALQDGSWVFGDVFFQKYYTVFDFQNKRIGLAKSSKHNHELCPADWEYDVAYNGTALSPASTPGAISPLTPFPPPAPIPPPPPVPTAPTTAMTLAPVRPTLPTLPSGDSTYPVSKYNSNGKSNGSNDGDGDGPSQWGIFVGIFLVASVLVYQARRRRQRLRQESRRQQYSIASRYEDNGDADSPFGDMELT